MFNNKLVECLKYITVTYGRFWLKKKKKISCVQHRCTSQGGWQANSNSTRFQKKPGFTFDCFSKSTTELLSSGLDATLEGWFRSHDIIFSSKPTHSWLMRSLRFSHGTLFTTNLHCICEEQCDYICHLSTCEILY